MSKPKLVIVESPGKINKINSILGKDYLVKASVGHIRELDKKDLGIDIENDFSPRYVIISDKRKVVNDLKSCIKSCSEVILAADEDREGEAIAASLSDVLNLKNPKRIVFNEITKSALTNALQNPREINYNLVKAQETRMFLDKIVGYKISPLLWSNIGNKLSAGRVQSVVVKLIIDKENEINSIAHESYYKINGFLSSLNDKSNKLESTLYELDKEKSKNMYKGDILKLENSSKVEKLLNVLSESKYIVNLIEDKNSFRNPSPPFITSTLQQEASRKFGLNVKTTMTIAQKLYEKGHITYMRTDSNNLSDEALKSCENYIINQFGKDYHNKKKYDSKSKNAQEAHEAIRPTHIEKDKVEGDELEKKLYSLIWKRTVACQMSSAKISINNIYIDITHNKLLPYYFLATNETITFEGFLKVYNIKSEDEEELKKSNTNFKKKDELNYDKIIGKKEYPKSLGRFNEANLVKKLEDYGIGRPSTYANIINKIQERQYVKKVDFPGEEKEIKIGTLFPDKLIKWTKSKTILGKEKQKLIPTEIGKTVTQYLNENFDYLMEYKFTSKMENKLDDISNGTVNWLNILKKFYEELNPKIQLLLKDKTKFINNNEKLLGKNSNDCEIFVTVSKYGPVVKLLDGKKPKYASIEKPLTIDNITLEQAKELLEYPKVLGKYKENDVVMAKGKFGYYIKYDNKNYPIENKNILLDDIIKLIDTKSKEILNEFEINKKKYQIRNGQYGPYISYYNGKKINFVSIPKNIEINTLNENKIIELVNNKKKFKK